jgi:hypothetical protein
LIGPVDSYQSVYVSLCGQDFPNYSLGIDHEMECPLCRYEENCLENESYILMEYNGHPPHKHEWNDDDYCVICGADGRG